MLTGDAPAPPAGLSQGALRALQFAAGNQAVARLVGATPGGFQRQEAPPAAGSASVGALILDDDAAALAPGQLRKSQFLAELRAAVTSTANEALAPVGRTAADCPYIDQAFARYGGQSAEHVERALRKYAPDAAGASSAKGYVAPVSARVRQGVMSWAAAGAPERGEEAPGALAGALGSIGGALGGAVASAAGCCSSPFPAARGPPIRWPCGPAWGRAGPWRARPGAAWSPPSGPTSAPCACTTTSRPRRGPAS